MAGNSGEVHDVRSRNRPLKIFLTVLAILLIVTAAAILLYFFVFSGGNNEPQLKVIPSNMISFKQADSSTGQAWAEKIEEFLKAYENPPSGPSTTCTEFQKLDPDVPCAIDVRYTGACSMKNHDFGYTDGHASPCVVLKLGKVEGFVPEPFDNLTVAVELGMPAKLAEYIKDLNYSATAIAQRKLNTTWITCEGVGGTDKENVGGLQYFFPGYSNETSDILGIPNVFFPYLKGQNQSAYLEPFIFVKFNKPQPELAIQVKCTPWAKNIDPEDGSVTFELRLD